MITFEKKKNHFLVQRIRVLINQLQLHTLMVSLMSRPIQLYLYPISSGKYQICDLIVRFFLENETDHNCMSFPSSLYQLLIQNSSPFKLHFWANIGLLLKSMQTVAKPFFQESFLKTAKQQASCDIYIDSI